MFIFEYSIDEIYRQQIFWGQQGSLVLFLNINIANVSRQLTNAWSDLWQGKNKNITFKMEK